MNRARRGVLASGSIAAVAASLLSGCGSSGSAAGVGELLPTTTAAATATPTPAATLPPTTATVSAADSAFKGSGTFIYDHGGVVATFKLPADRTQDDVIGLKDFIRQTHSQSLRIISVTVTNHSSKAFAISGFELQGTPGAVPLYPVSTYVNLAMALPGVSSKPDLVSAGTIAALTSAASIPAGKELTTLVGTQRGMATVTGVVYRQGSSTVTLEPLWQIRQAAAKLAHEQEQAAKRLARQQARAARQLARQRAAKHK